MWQPLRPSMASLALRLLAGGLKHRCAPVATLRRPICPTAAGLSTRASTNLPQDLSNWADLFSRGADAFTLPDVNDNLADGFADLASRRAQRVGGGSGVCTMVAADASAAAERTAAAARALRVFVPLCGRTRDLAWLAEQGTAAVVGLDAIPQALQLWGEENGGLAPLAASPRVSTFRSVAYANVRLICCDIFDLPVKAMKSSFDLIWDRGGLTSIAADRRADYMSVLRSVLREDGELLLEFLACNLPLEGALHAPDALGLARVAGFAQSDVVKDDDVRAAYPSFTPPGLAYLREVVLRARVKGEPDR